ncbi:MAG: ATP-binding cassette domain-containing protein [Bacteroidetes bacterium]|nr:ATP-binding cassette domain-containing protein [Bacteroidota bacterium]MBL0096203.1 ATP-binding cassette domain-containing protein [Bacteroidota bacterium]
MKEEVTNTRGLIKHLKLERSDITAIYFYAILSGLIQLSLPLGIQAILGFVLGATMVTSVYVLIFIIISAVLIVGYLQIRQMKIIEKIQQKIFVNFAFEFAEKIPNMDLKKADQYYLPEKINHFFETINIQKGVSKLLIEIPAATIQIIFGLVLLSLYHSLFLISSLLLIAILWTIFKITGRKGIETSINESNNKYDVIAWLEELGRVIKSFKYSQGSHLNLIKTDKKLLDYIKARKSHFSVLIFQFKSLVFLKVAITAIMLILGTSLLFSQKINIGQFVAAEIIILTIISAMEKLITSLEYVYDVITGMLKINRVLEFPNEKEGKLILTSKELNITMSNMTFSYSEKKEIFQDVSLRIPSKAVTCISGEENSGKSTFLKLLTGSYMDFKGSIQFNDLPLKNYSFESLRSQMGIFLYDQDIFEGTLYENITLGRNETSIEHIMEIAKKSGLENFISFFPDSFESMIDPMGRKLPSTTIRKILLLRALINNPVLLVLEEPWLQFDEETKQNLQHYLLSLGKEKTVVISTNDKDFIKKCDIHYTISNGSINKIEK